MKDLFVVFENMKLHGPGSEETTLGVLKQVNRHVNPQKILDIGCGIGFATMILAKATKDSGTAVDNHQPFVDHINGQAEMQGLSDRITTLNQSMFHLDLPRPGFDFIWSAASAYAMGFNEALEEWSSLLYKEGLMFISDLVWMTDAPSQECADFWKIEYPVMADTETRENQARAKGYRVLDSFIQPDGDWVNYYNDMETSIHKAISQIGPSDAYKDLNHEINVRKKYGKEFGYLGLLLQKTELKEPRFV